MKVFTAILFLLLAFSVQGQSTDEQLAEQFYSDGEFEKAAGLYKKVFRKNNRSIGIYENYLRSLIALEDLKGSEALIKKQIKSYPKSPYYKVDLGYLYSIFDQEEKAQKLFSGLIKNASKSKNEVLTLAQSFSRRRLDEYTLETYEKGAQSQGVLTFWRQLSSIYRNKDEHKDLVDLSLVVLRNDPDLLPQVFGNLDKTIEDEVFSDYLKKETLNYIQKYPSNQVYDELLYKTYLQQKKYKAAFRQVVAIDKRNRLEGEKIVAFAESCLPIKRYETAIEAYAYIVENYPESIYYKKAQIGSLNASYLELSSSFNPSKERAQQLLASFDNYFQENTLDYTNSIIGKRLAELSIYYTKDIARGVQLLEKIIKLPRQRANFLAESKLLLGDAYLIQNNIWDAKIMYGQVDKQYKEDAYGQLAKFKNAKLSYFTGDLEWAKSQLDILKTATTQLISNNAIELSLLIQDNTGLDSTQEAMKEYANAAFLLYQNDVSGCQQILNLLPFKYPDHQLEDEVLFLQAQLEQKKANYEKALSLYEKIYDNFSQDILADNAMFQAAEILLFGVDDPTKASALYERLILEYNSSLFAVEARKKFYALKDGKTKEELFFEGVLN